MMAAGTSRPGPRGTSRRRHIVDVAEGQRPTPSQSPRTLPSVITTRSSKKFKNSERYATTKRKQAATDAGVKKRIKQLVQWTRKCKKPLKSW
ncbi:unnamed protein product, partial [Amoebophrya sp. A25]|eukprot:GSA25T00020541001.1